MQVQIEYNLNRVPDDLSCDRQWYPPEL